MRIGRYFVGSRFVYVVIATSGELIAVCKVFSTLATAQAEFERLKTIWGGANVCLASRSIDAQAEAEKRNGEGV